MNNSERFRGTIKELISQLNENDDFLKFGGFLKGNKREKLLGSMISKIESDLQAMTPSSGDSSYVTIQGAYNLINRLIKKELKVGKKTFSPEDLMTRKDNFIKKLDILGSIQINWSVP